MSYASTVYFCTPNRFTNSYVEIRTSPPLKFLCYSAGVLLPRYVLPGTRSNSEYVLPVVLVPAGYQSSRTEGFVEVYSLHARKTSRSTAIKKSNRFYYRDMCEKCSRYSTVLHIFLGNLSNGCAVLQVPGFQ